jgi:hypothetical protein
METPNQNLYVHFKSLLLYDWCMFIEFHPSINILIQADNVNLATIYFGMTFVNF